MATDTFAAKLEALKREVRSTLRAAGKKKAPGRRRAGRRAADWHSIAQALAFGAAKLAAILALPFLVYVRSSTYLYYTGAAPWPSVLGGALLTLGLVVGYATWLSRRFSGQARAATIGRWVALPLVLGWCLYAALYLSRVNAKSDEIREYYSAVNPVLRVALSTVILVDPGIVITDTRRTLGDYARMGLPTNPRTRHAEEEDGWVHAVDLRTRERGEIRNRSVQLYFWLMGFSTLRHVGTADHLHVQLARRS